MSRYWDERALKALKSGEPALHWKRYVRSAFSLATEIGLSHVQSKKVNLLKTDLWNDGVEGKYQSRPTVGKYQNRGNFRLYGIDISRVVCLQAKSKLKKVHIIQGTIENLPFKEGFFHIILDLSTSDHIPENKAINVLEEYRRVLKDKGILVLIFLCQNLRSKFARAIKYGKTRSSSIQDSYLFSERIVESVEKNFDVLEHYFVGTFVSGRVLSKMPFRRFIVNSMLTLEYSKLSKFVLKNLGDFQVIIATKLEKSKT